MRARRSVERVDERPPRRFDDVGRDPAAGETITVDLKLNAYNAQGFRSPGYRSDVEARELCLHAGRAQAHLLVSVLSESTQAAMRVAHRCVEEDAADERQDGIADPAV